MIKIRASAEFITDLFSPCKLVRQCIQGLPKDVKLVHVSMDDNNAILFLYEDGKMETTDILLEYISPVVIYEH